MKSYTDLQQSKKLAEILSFESADMYWDYDYSTYNRKYKYYPMVINDQFDDICIPAWSLAALFRLLPKSAQLEKGNATELYRVILPIELKASDWYVEPVDACYELILKLHEQNLL